MRRWAGWAGWAGWAVILAVLAAPVAVEAQRPTEGNAERRAELEAEVRRRFLSRVALHLELTESQRARLTEVLREGAEARRRLAHESMDLHRDVSAAVRWGDAPPSTYEALLDRLHRLREAERALERDEEARLAETLDPRQRLMFQLMRMQFNDRIRGMRGRHPAPHHDGPPGGGPGSPRSDPD